MCTGISSMPPAGRQGQRPSSWPPTYVMWVWRDRAPAWGEGGGNRGGSSKRLKFMYILTPADLVCQAPRKWWSAADAGWCGPADGVVRAVPATVPTSVAVAVRRGCGREGATAGGGGVSATLV